MGGKLRSFYFAFGSTDVYVIVDLPDNVTAAAVALAVNQGGGATIKTVVLIPPENLDKACKVAVDQTPAALTYSGKGFWKQVGLPPEVGCPEFGQLRPGSSKRQ